VEKLTVEKLAVSIPEAAQIVGVSRARFYKLWVHEGLITPVDLGARGNSVILDDLRAALQKRREVIGSKKRGAAKGK
jgi:predicted DNA-binding transcriptional regulator AlpA